MTDSDSSTPVEDPVFLKQSKKKKKKQKKKKSRHADNAAAEDDDLSCHSENRTKRSSQHISEEFVGSAPVTSDVEDENGKNVDAKKSKKKKKKKDKKRKRSSSSTDDDIDKHTVREDEDSSCNDNDKKSKKKRKKSTTKRSKDKEQQKEMPLDDKKLVSRSAIEYYPDDLKHLQLKKNQEETAASISNTNTKNDAKNEKHTTTNTNDDSPYSKTNPNIENGNIKNTNINNNGNITLLLFYQYVEPPWTESQYRTAFQYVNDLGNQHSLTGRMRIAREGLNCTLTGTPHGIRAWCASLRTFDGGRSKPHPTKPSERLTEFAETEFKLTDDLPPKQRFPKLHAFEVVELVNYGLAGKRAPTIAAHGGTHLEPAAYHDKMSDENTVVIDVRNHYEAKIGRFVPPVGGATVIDPGMRKSTEFPVWLDKKETKEMLRGKQVLMYCTGGVRCERASALLKQKIDKEEDTKELGIKGVFQLQGGVDKYFKEFPEGGMWKGKNYTFDKRFAHAPPAVEALERKKKVLGDDDGGAPLDALGKENPVTTAAEEILGECEACHKPWDMYRGKRRCPTCGVPSLICRSCFEADRDGTKKLGRNVRCDLCVAESVTNKRELREREERETKEYERKMRQKMDDDYEPPVQRKHAVTRKPKGNPERITRLFLKNMCARQMDEAKLLEFLHPARVTHIQWLMDKSTKKFYGSAFIEAKTAEDAGSILAVDGMTVLGRRIKVKYQRADEKDNWPIPNTEVSSS